MEKTNQKEANQQEVNLIKRNIKACVFTDLFSDKEYLLKLYKALHPEDCSTTEDDLDIVTLETVLVNDLYNDLGFNVKDRLICLVEAQATWTMNILIRVILYYAKTLNEYINKKNIDLYSSKKAIIPQMEFYVVFTGERQDKPETINLSREFFGGLEIGLDVTVKMLYGEKNDIIGEYVTFTKVYDEQRKKYGRTEEAITETIRICKDKNVLKEYLDNREMEVVRMMMTIFDEEQIMRAYTNTIREEGIAEGRVEGRVEGRAEGRAEGRVEGRVEGMLAQLIDLVKDGLIGIADASKRANMSEQEFKLLLNK